ncbi:LysR family transcriptional regulator [Bacteriovorax sp. Seq25_V]|uniref:LysR family transcriptional regulator n=1 Tax=Bacteriovorax sp. Seq25_V TaxID=1201288 RepID=UPI00038A52B7|nr:LysR family transcriptional regulator [Bacteriovorax sp. Seq25_V]EQC46808.1 transcriptional regulator, LysR family [Bacteriovorax sp. Seq25_V]
MNILSKDLNLLVLIKILNEEKNLTRAAKKMGISQPALSGKLNRLRDEFDDPLFVKSQSGVTPTPKALDLASRIDSVIRIIDDFYFKSNDIDLKAKTDIITLFTTEYVDFLLLPKLLAKVDEVAPNIKLRTFNTSIGLPEKELVNGECDIAIAGYFVKENGNFYQQNLRTDKFVALYDKCNKNVKGDLSLENYLRSSHILTTFSGDFDGIVDVELRKANKVRKVVAGTTSFLVPQEIISKSNYILSCLEPLADKSIHTNSNLVKSDLPFSVKRVSIKQFWHERTHYDPLRIWLRKEIFNILSVDDK